MQIVINKAGFKIQFSNIVAMNSYLKPFFYILILFVFSSCQGKIDRLEHKQMDRSTQELSLLTLDQQDGIIHKGIFSPDLRSFYYTLSDSNYTRFEVFEMSRKGGTWSKARKAFFNTEHSEHGMSFSTDGETLYFSSTRPTRQADVPDTWHLWMSKKVHGIWTEAVWIDIPNLRDKLLSHPTLTSSGKMYFHASKLDYSEMDLYVSEFREGKFLPAQKVLLPKAEEMAKCTPFVAEDESYLLFARIGEALDLMVTYKQADGSWSAPKLLPDSINQNGQGNPFVTPDHQYLIYTTLDKNKDEWGLKLSELDDLLHTAKK